MITTEMAIALLLVLDGLYSHHLIGAFEEEVGHFAAGEEGGGGLGAVSDSSPGWRHPQEATHGRQP